MKDFEKQEKYTEQFDMYFAGNHMEGLKGPNGGICYWLCQYMDKRHFVESKEPGRPMTVTTWCKIRDEYEDGSHCNDSCEHFASCETCGGFSAVRCGACDIIRYD
jgi:hypothetical protein